MPIIIPRPVIDHMDLELDKDVANCIVRFGYDINWPVFARSTNLAYQEKVELIGVDPGSSPMVLYTWPLKAFGIQPNGDVTTHRTFEQTIPWADLNEDPDGRDEIAVDVTLTPLFPAETSRRTATVTVDSP